MMSFPIDYWFYGESKGVKHTLVGNAVPPKLSYAVAVAIAKAEGKKIPNKYKPIRHNNKLHFVNLNGMTFEKKQEKEKREDAKFKYHIPYLIINAYRVELNNYQPKSESKERIWKVEIHYSQGKDKAKVLTPHVTKRNIPDDLHAKIESYIQDVSRSLPTKKANFQRLYCMTSEERKKARKLGPYELLDSTRKFLDNNIPKEDQNKNVRVNAAVQLPYEIVVGYYIMTRIVNRMR